MEFNKTCRKVAKILGEDQLVVHDVVMFLFKFIEDVMKDPIDTHDILLHNLFRFQLKPRFKDNKQKDYSPNENSKESKARV